MALTLTGAPTTAARRRSISSRWGASLGASITTVELSPDGAGTRLKSTTQLASFIGEGMIKGHEAGNNGSLDNLVRYFTV